MAMKKSILDVELMDWPGTRDSEAEDDPYRCRFDNRTESLVVVDAMLLREPVDNPPSLMASKGAVRVVLVPENPFAGDDISTRRSRNKPPSASWLDTGAGLETRARPTLGALARLLLQLAATAATTPLVALALATTTWLRRRGRGRGMAGCRCAGRYR
jgi:hypothetical protein